MGCSNVPTPVFIDTNLGTRLAVPVCPDINAMEFKRQLEWMHLNCFPEFGTIRVNALMVKQKSRYYHLSESLPLKYAFLGSNVTWFLQTDVHRRRTPDHVESLKRKRKRKDVKREFKVGCPGQGPIQRPLIEKEMLCQFATGSEVNWSKKRDNNVIAEALSDTFSEPASVSGIIKKYFSDYDEVASGFTTVRSRHTEWLNSSTECKHLNIQSEIISPVTGHIPPQVSRDVWLEKPGSEASREKSTKPEVGKRLLLASDSLGLTPSNQRSVLSLFRYSDGKSPFQKRTAAVRNLAFEMTEESD